MANKRIYRNVKDNNGVVVGLRDPYTERCFALDENNAEYQKYQKLLAANRALALDEGAAVPGGTTDSPEEPVYPYTPPT